MEPRPAVAVGRLASGGAWVGFAPAEDGYRLAFGDEAGELPPVVTDPATLRADLLNVALAYFGDAAEPAPDELQATHGDVADLVRWLAATAGDEAPPALRMAVDAIDDGLAADAVMLLLEAASAAIGTGREGEQADPIDLLADRLRALGG